MNLSLFHIQQDHLNLINLIEENGGEVNDEIMNQLALTEENFKDKAVSYSNIVKVLDYDVKSIDEEIKRLQDLKKKKSKAAETFETKLSEAMQQFGFDKIETPTRKLSFRKSESVVITDETLIPLGLKDFVPATFTPVKDAIKRAIKSGEEVPGAQLVTKMNLQIK
jgi:hypothetical protein